MPAAPRRKDATRNRERIVAVARDLVDDGTPLQLNDIARRVGMGVGTVYRHFPTAETLLETVATPSLEALVAYGQQVLTDEDPARALAEFLTRTIEVQTTDASLSPVTAAATDALPHTTELKQALSSTGNRLFQGARYTGSLRADITSDDLVPLMCGIAYAVNVHGTPATRTETARRYLAVLLEGMLTIR